MLDFAEIAIKLGWCCRDLGNKRMVVLFKVFISWDPFSFYLFLSDSEWDVE